ncbi:pyroglutamylated RF-amide peptide receptor-like [Oculina patagonica]
MHTVLRLATQIEIFCCHWYNGNIILSEGDQVTEDALASSNMSMRSVPQTAAVAITTVLSILIVIVIVGNSLVCLIVKRNRDLRIPINFLLANLAVADMMIATFHVPEYILSHTFTHPDGMTGTMLCKLLTGGNFTWVGAASSVFTLVAISAERYYAVTYPRGIRGKITTGKLKVIIPCSWIFAFIMNIPEFLVFNFYTKIGDCEEVWPEKWMGVANSLSWLFIVSLLPLALMVWLYSRIVYNLWFKRYEDNQLTHRQKAVVKIRKRVTLMAVIVSVIFGVCWLTDACMYVLKYIRSPYSDVAYGIASIMILFNSAVNPFVYALVNQRFRQKMKGMLCCKCRSTIRIHTTDMLEA